MKNARWLIVAGGALCLSFFLFGVIGGHLVLPVKPGGPALYNTAAILRQVQTLSQLVTVKYVVEKVVQLEDVKWYGENRVVLVAHGVIKAGLDLQNLQLKDIRTADKKISILLSRPKITDVYLDEHRTQILERKTGFMRAFDKALEQNARRQAVDQLRAAAVANGILKDAEERGREQVIQLFHQLGFEQVELTWK
jgi:hypothetical protein